MINDGIDVDTAADSVAKPYADNYFEYDGSQRVTLETSAVCAGCPGGGTTSDSFSYSAGPGGGEENGTGSINTRTGCKNVLLPSLVCHGYRRDGPFPGKSNLSRYLFRKIEPVPLSFRHRRLFCLFSLESLAMAAVVIFKQKSFRGRGLRSGWWPEQTVICVVA